MKFKKFAAVILMSVMIGSMSLSGCGINKNATAVTMTGDAIDTIEVDMGYANFAARIQQASYDSIFASYYGEDYWTNESYAQDGKNMQESIKDSVMENIETQCLLEAHMDDYGVEITDDEKAAMKEAAEKFMSDNTKSALKEVGATEEYVERYLYLQTVQQKMSTAIRATADTEVSDEEAAQRTFSYVKISLTTYTDDSGNQQTYTEDQVNRCGKKMLMMQQRRQRQILTELLLIMAIPYRLIPMEVMEKSESDGGFCDAVITAANSMKERGMYPI